MATLERKRGRGDMDGGDGLDSDAEWRERARGWAADFKDGRTPAFCGEPLDALVLVRGTAAERAALLAEWLVRRLRRAGDGGAWVEAAWARARAATGAARFSEAELAGAAAAALRMLCRGVLLARDRGVPGRAETAALLERCGGGPAERAAAADAALEALCDSVSDRYCGLRYGWPKAWEAARELVRASSEPGRFAAAMARRYAVLEGDEAPRVEAVERMLDETGGGYHAALALHGLAVQGLDYSRPRDAAYRAIVARAPARFPGTLEAVEGREAWACVAAEVAAKPLVSPAAARE